MGENRVIKYKDYIDVNQINTNEEIGKDFNYRYSLIVGYRYPLNTKNVLVIMRNPNIANSIQSDRTVNNVLHYCKDMYKKVYLANLYPCRSSEPKEINRFVKSLEFSNKMKLNVKEIKKLLSQVDDVIVAWGSNDKLNEKTKNIEKGLIKEIVEMIHKQKKSIYAVRFIECENPWHPLNWKESFKLEMYEWNNL